MWPVASPKLTQVGIQISLILAFVPINQREK